MKLTIVLNKAIDINGNCPAGSNTFKADHF